MRGRNTISKDWKITEEAKTNIEVQKGGFLSQILFIIYLADALKHVRNIKILSSHETTHMQHK